MKYLIIIASLFILSNTAYSQIRAYQVGFPPTLTDEYFLGIETTGPKDNLGKWIHRDSMPFGRLDTAWVQDSTLIIVDVNGDTTTFVGGSGGGGEFAFWLLGDSSPVPTPSDSATRDGYTQWTGENDGSATTIEIHQDGVLEFDGGLVLSGRILKRYMPLEQDQGNQPWYESIVSVEFPGSTRNNDVFVAGWNLGPGASRVSGTGTGFGYSWEYFYSPVLGSHVYEVHPAIITDSAGVVTRPISYLFDEVDHSNWGGVNIVSSFWYQDPTNGNNFFDIARSGTNGTSLYLKGSATGLGASMTSDVTNNLFEIANYGMTNPFLLLNTFHTTQVNRLRIGTLQPDPTIILGRNSANDVTGLVAGYGLIIDGTDLEADTNEVVTPSDLDDAVDAIQESHAFYEVGTSVVPNSISDHIYKVGGKTGFGTSVPETKIHVGNRIVDDGSFTYDSNTVLIVHQSQTTGLNDPKSVLNLSRQGETSINFGLGASFNLSRYENVGASSRTRLDFSLAHSNYDVMATTVMTLLSSGNVGIGSTAPAQKLHVVGEARITGSGGTATTITGRDADEDLTDVGTGWGIDLTSGNLVIDSSQVATQYDLTQISGGSDSIPINHLLAATNTNIINNAAYAQEWQWNTLASGSGLKLTSNSTAAASNTQRLFEVSLSGANANASQTTVAGYFSNAHTGTGANNYGVYADGATGTGVFGATTTGFGVQGSATGAGAALYGTTTTGFGLWAVATSGIGAFIQSTSGTTALIAGDGASTNDVKKIIEVRRTSSGGAGANGIGASIDFTLETSTAPTETSNQLISTWTTATQASRTSQFIINGINSTASNQILTLDGDGSAQLNDYGDGNFTGTPTFGAAFDTDGNIIEVAVDGDGSATNELQELQNTSDATSHTVTLTTAAGSIQLVEGSNITLTTTGTADDGIVTIASTGGGGGTMSSWLLAASGTGGTETITDGETVTITGAGINVATRSGSNVTITGTEVDGSTSNEIQTLDVSGTSQPITFDLSSDASDPTLTGAGISVVSASGNAITVTSTEVDGSVTNELTIIETDNTVVSTGAPTLDFSSTDFTITETPTDEFNYTINAERIQDLVGAMLTGNTETDITVDYQDADGTIDFVVTGGAGGIDAYEDNSLSESDIAIIDLGDGFDWNPSTGGSVDLQHDFNEFITDAVEDANEFVILWDTDGSNPEKRAVSSFGGADGNGMWTLANDNTNIANSTFEVGVPGYLHFRDGTEDDLFIDATNDLIGMGTSSPAARVHIANTSGTNFLLENTGANTTTDMQTRAHITNTAAPFTLSIRNQDTDIDISGSNYEMARIQATKASATVPGGTLVFSVAYDTVLIDNILTLTSRETGATDGFTTIAGGMRLKWAASASTTVTLNTGDYGLTTTAAGTKTVTLPDATATIVGQVYEIFNSGAGAGTIAITGGSSDVIKGDTVVNLDEMITVRCVANNTWAITN
jgi:hypothetical protein